MSIESRWRPPRPATALLRWSIPVSDREHVLAELAELFVLKRRRGRVTAGLWYWWQAAAFTTRLLFTRAGREVVAEADGNVAGRRSDGPGDPFFISFAQDVRLAWRSLRRSGGFSLVVVVTLALGIGANTAMFSLVRAALLTRLPYDQPQRIAMVYETVQQWTRVAVSPANFVDWRERSTSFDAIAAYEEISFNLVEGDRPERVNGAIVTADFFAVFGVPPTLGRGFVADDDVPGAPPVAVLSHGYWQARFGGDSTVVGGTVSLDGITHTVVGVMPRAFRMFLQVEQDVWTAGLLNIAAAADTATSFRWHWVDVVARLRADRTRLQAQREMAGIATALSAEFPASNRGFGVNVADLRELVVGNTRPRLLLLLGAVGFVLLIGCANVSNLMLARSAARRHEAVLRMALGASRARAMRQIWAEAVILGLVGGAAGVGLAILAIDATLAANVGGLRVVGSVGLDPVVLAFTLVLSLAAGAVTSLAPALRISDGHLETALRQGGRGAEGRGVAQGALVALESGVVFVLLIGAALMLSSFVRLNGTDTGFSTTGKVTFALTLADRKYPTADDASALYRTIADRLEAIPGVTSSGVTTSLALASSNLSFGTHVQGQPSVQGAPPTHLEGVTPGYLETLGLPLLAGRLFDTGDSPTAPIGVISNDVAELFFGDANPLGAQVSIIDSLAGPWFTVIGIVGDAKHNRVDAPTVPTVYLPMAQMPFVPTDGDVLVQTDLEAPLGLFPQIREAVRDVDPHQPIANARLFDQVKQASVASMRFQALLLLVFAGTALALGAVGIYGVVSYTVGRQTREMGIRMALGARPAKVAALMVRNGIAPVVIGLLMGIAAAIGLTRYMVNMVYQVSTTDPATFVGVGFGLLSVAVIACYLPARRAARIAPVEALRAD